jgi:hypothetical protein
MQLYMPMYATMHAAIDANIWRHTSSSTYYLHAHRCKGVDVERWFEKDSNLGDN